MTQYNSRLSSARVIVEQCIGQLKSRWRHTMLLNADNPLVKTQSFYVACILHNFVKLNGDEWDESLFGLSPED